MKHGSVQFHIRAHKRSKHLGAGLVLQLADFDEFSSQRLVDANAESDFVVHGVTLDTRGVHSGYTGRLGQGLRLWVVGVAKVETNEPCLSSGMESQVALSDLGVL